MQLPLNKLFAIAPQGAIGTPVSLYAYGEQSLETSDSPPSSWASSLDFTYRLWF